MKFLKYLLVFVIIVLLVFFGRGLMTSEVSYENEITVNQPAKITWEVMSDESSMADWIPGFIKIEHVSGTPNTVGAVSKIYVEDNGQEMIMSETITEVVPQQKMAMTFDMDFMEMDYAMELKEVNGATHIKTNTTAKGKGLFAKSVLSWMSGGMKEQEDRNLQNLKTLAENAGK